MNETGSSLGRSFQVSRIPEALLRDAGTRVGETRASVICGSTSSEGKRGDRYECRARDPTRRKAIPEFPLKAFQNCTRTRWKGLFTSLMHAAFWPERMPRARIRQRATISGARGSAGQRGAAARSGRRCSEFPNGSFPRDPRQDVQGIPVDILWGKSGLGRRSSPQISTSIQ